MIKRIILVVLLGIFALPTHATPNAPLKVVGYVPYWNSTISTIQFDSLTHVIYAFAYPKSDGSITPLADPAKLSQLVTAAHAHNVKVLISFANNGSDAAFETLASSAATINTFVANVAALCDQYQLDGVDIDWEYPDAGASANHYVNLMQALGIKLHSQNRLLTAAVMPKGSRADAILDGVFDQVDWLNVMVYNNPWQDHSSYAFAVQSLDYWQQRGLPAAKTVLGIPFYSYYAPGKTVMYRELVAQNPVAPCSDSTQFNGMQVNYNGFRGVQAKTRLAQDRGIAGVMIWHLGHDTSDNTSLLGAINAQITGDSSALLTCHYTFMPAVINQ